MTQIAAEQLERTAIIYVRQSTAFQVTNNIESGRRQYGLVERARQLGWNDVQVIDDDLGRSGGGIARPGLKSCWPRSASGASAPCYRLRPPDSPAMAETGILCWSSVDWLAL